MRSPVTLSLSAVIALALATPALAQDTRRPTGSGSSTGSSAAPRGGSSSGGSTSSSAGSSSSSSGGSSVSTGASRGTAVSRPSREPQTARARSSSGQSASGGGAAVPAYSRPRGDRAVRGEAVDRGNNPLPGRGGSGSGYYYGYPSYYGSYGYYGRPYAYGYYPLFHTGFGYFYYDPYWTFNDPYGYYGYGAYGRRDDRGDRDYNIGSLRLKVDPKNAEVYVDGLYRGIVNEFDGVFQRLKIEAGAHRLEIRAPGYRPLVFDVLVTPGETTTYRGDLKRQ